MCWFCFAASWAVDTGRSNSALISGSEAWYLSLTSPHMAPSGTKNTSCICIHKTINNVNIGRLPSEQPITVYLLFAWVGGEIWEITSKFPTFQLFHLFMKNGLCSAKKCNTEFLYTPFSIVSWESLSTALQGASPPLCVELHLKCCNTKIEQTAWNETWGLFLHVLRHQQITYEQKMKVKPTVPIYSLAKVGICATLPSSPQSRPLGLSNHPYVPQF